VIYLVGAVLVGIVAVFASGAVAGAAAGAAPDPARMGPIILLALSPVVLLEVFLLLKFSLAPAQTIDTKSINIFGSWGLTKGHFGKVFLTYLLAAVIYCVIYAIALAIVLGVWTAMGAGGLQEIMRPDMTSVAAVFAAPRLVYFLIMGFAGAIGLALIASPGAALYQQITGRNVEAAFE
jgi:hypothetical protein